MSTETRDLEQKTAAKLLPEYWDWAKGQAMAGGCQATLVLSLAFLIASGLGYLALRNPELGDTLARLEVHFQLDDTDLPQGRYHCLLTHAFYWPHEFWQALLMIGGLIFFGSKAEMRTGSWYVLLLFITATVAGAGFYLYIHSGAGASVSAFSSLRNENPWPFAGCGAGVTALITTALLVQLTRPRASEGFLLVMAAVLFVSLDWIGLLRPAGSRVAFGPRLVAIAVAVAFALIDWLLRARRTPESTAP